MLTNYTLRVIAVGMNEREIPPKTIAQLVKALGGPNAVGNALCVSAQAVCNMRARGTIRPKYWSAIIDLAQEQNVPGVTFAYLAMLEADRFGGQGNPSSISEEAA